MKMIPQVYKVSNLPLLFVVSLLAQSVIFAMIVEPPNHPILPLIVAASIFTIWQNNKR